MVAATNNGERGVRPITIEARRGLAGVWEARADFTFGWWTPTHWNSIMDWMTVKAKLEELNDGYRAIWATDEEDKLKEMC